jgi:hypothetical protein
MKRFEKNTIECIGSTRLIGIKAGKERSTFLEIWMVVVENRIFARSWGLSERSWYHTFLNDNKGFLKCGDHITPIVACIPADILAITGRINEAYLKKYDFGENSFYATGITEQRHADKTMEFIPY